MNAEPENMHINNQATVGASVNTSVEVKSVNNEDESSDTLSWQALEFESPEKSALWYAMLGVATVVSSAVIYFATRGIFSTVVVGVMLLAFGLFIARKPQKISYVLHANGVLINNKPYLFESFKAFSIRQLESGFVVDLFPVKRLMPTVSMRFGDDVADAVAGVLTQHMPAIPYKHDWVEFIVSRIRG